MKRKTIAAGLLSGMTLAGVGLAEPTATTGDDGQFCMSADLGIVPAKVTYSNGYSRSMLGQFGKVTLWRIEGPNFQPHDYRIKYNMFPLETDTTGRDTVWDWATDLPDLYVIEASGETFRAEGTRTMTDEEPTQVTMDITVLGRETHVFKGCAYEVMKLKVVHGEAGKPYSEALILYDPELWTGFGSELHRLDGSPAEIVEPLDFVTTR